MKKFVTSILVSIMTMTTVSAKNIPLPAPEIKGGMPVLEAIDHRASAVGDSFPSGDVSNQELATLLWAASGRNRQDKGWVVPTAMGKAPYAVIYVIGKKGVFRYNGKEHTLSQISDKDIRQSISPQNFVSSVPYSLVFVIDGVGVNVPADVGSTLVGAMSQNIYLASQALNIGVRYMTSMKADVVRKELDLNETELPLAIMSFGHY